MKTSKVCPKCNGTDIIRIPGNGLYGPVNSNIQVGYSKLSVVLVHRYVCAECGYSEEWIAKGDLETLKEAFKK